jgi:hypothetical protein
MPRRDCWKLAAIQMHRTVLDERRYMLPLLLTLLGSSRYVPPVIAESAAKQFLKVDRREVSRVKFDKALRSTVTAFYFTNLTASCQDTDAWLAQVST